jgi:hypothetical protein
MISPWPKLSFPNIRYTASACARSPDRFIRLPYQGIHIPDKPLFEPDGRKSRPANLAFMPELFPSAIFPSQSFRLFEIIARMAENCGSSLALKDGEVHSIQAPFFRFLFHWCSDLSIDLNGGSSTGAFVSSRLYSFSLSSFNLLRESLATWFRKTVVWGAYIIALFDHGGIKQISYKASGARSVETRGISRPNLRAIFFGGGFTTCKQYIYPRQLFIGRE